MKSARAISRCEVAGRVYLPGDEMLVTDEQLAYLKSQNAATEVRVLSVTPVLPAGATMADAEAHYVRMVGKPRPKKGNRK